MPADTIDRGFYFLTALSAVLAAVFAASFWLV
jgi:hypothetical protein